MQEEPWLDCHIDACFGITYDLCRGKVGTEGSMSRRDVAKYNTAWRMNAGLISAVPRNPINYEDTCERDSGGPILRFKLVQRFACYSSIAQHFIP